MPAENEIAPNIQLALDYSRSFATAKPNIGLTEKEHIEGLANLLERTATENQALQARLTVQDQRVDELEALLLRLERANDKRASLITSEAYVVAVRAHGMSDALLELDNARKAARAALNPTTEAANHDE